MENNKWIDEAFKEAIELNKTAESYSKTIREFLDEYTPTILDKWANVVGRDKSIWLATILSDNDELNELIETLTAFFTIAGYMLAKSEENNNGTE